MIGLGPPEPSQTAGRCMNSLQKNAPDSFFDTSRLSIVTCVVFLSDSVMQVMQFMHKNHPCGVAPFEFKAPSLLMIQSTGPTLLSYDAQLNSFIAPIRHQR